MQTKEKEIKKEREKEGGDKKRNHLVSTNQHALTLAPAIKRPSRTPEMSDPQNLIWECRPSVVDSNLTPFPVEQSILHLPFLNEKAEKFATNDEMMCLVLNTIPFNWSNFN